MKVTAEAIVAAPREEVFALAVDIERWPQIIRGIERVEMLTSGPVRIGTRFRETRIMYGREGVEEMTFADLAPPDRFVLTAENHGARYRASHLFSEEGRGTRVTLDFEGSPVTLAARLMMPLAYLMAGSVRRQLAADLEDLKHAAEGMPTQASG